jgi:hypothetical protein
MTEIQRLQGTVSTFDIIKRTRTIIDLDGCSHLILPGSSRKTVRLTVGDRVSFVSFNLFGGPTAQDIEPLEPLKRGPSDSPSMAGVRASQVPRKV